MFEKAELKVFVLLVRNQNHVLTSVVTDDTIEKLQMRVWVKFSSNDFNVIYTKSQQHVFYIGR